MMTRDRCTICGHVERADEMRREEINLVLVCPCCGAMVCDGCWLHHLDVDCGNSKPTPAAAARTARLRFRPAGGQHRRGRR